ncbi:response regulator [Paenibacillus kribbensis]|uniref:DNA-binding response regulator n=1 Tax=Paenibacillus kribbensis TaxID=172713 RepID=A0A222WN55_9BACL|nr:response regulator [Paenibacillus kribbensis]ASR47392.1 DNA-binding response regulator [Paenibacillus kribbensis]
MWNLLVVDDESIVRMGLRYMLDWEDLGICWKAEAADGKEALRILEEENIHFVMTDIRMPGMDGIELAQKIRHRNPEIQIIFLSSYDTFSYVREALRLGAADYLHKPTMDEDEIADTMQKVISRFKLPSNEPPQRTEEERNEFCLSLLDPFTFPAEPMKLLPELADESYKEGYELAIIRKRCDAVQENEDSEQLRFLSILHLMSKLVAKDWGGLVFHRNFREMIWIAPVRSLTGDGDMPSYLNGLRQKVLELLNVRLIFACGSSACRDISSLPGAYMSALLRFPRNEQSDSFIVRRAKEYVDRHLLDDVTLAKVGESIHVSPGYLSRIFLKEIGENFSDYIIRNKMEIAQKMLRETSRKVYEIAADLGYSNPYYFSKLFKDRTGLTPLEYRNQ